jgi:hypothetical protein
MRITIHDSASVLGFATKGNASWKVWNRFITIEGKDAYHIGNICGTCAFFFQRLGGANQSLSPRGFQDQLSSGISELTDAQAALLSELLPNGDYETSLLFRVPHLVAPGSADDYFCQEQPALWGIDGFWGLPHDPRTEYYRGVDKPLGGGAYLFEFFVPMFPKEWLDASQVAELEARLKEGRRPTALAISVLDIKQPANWVGDPQATSHWCLAHYIVDGHHKLFAASRVGRPVGLVSALALGQGISGPEEHARLAAAQCAGPELHQQDPL